MKKLGLILLVIFLVVSGTACASNKPVEPTESPKVVETKSIPKEKEIKKAEEAIKAEPKKEEPKPEPAKAVEAAPAPRQIWYESHDYLGKSHSALIEDVDFLQRINVVLSSTPIAPEDIMPDMGGAAAIRVVENGVEMEYFFATGASVIKGVGEEPDSFNSPGTVLGNAGDLWFPVSDETLKDDLFKAYHNDQYKAEPEDTYQMSLSYDYIEIAQVEGEKEGHPITGTLARVELDNKINEADIALIQQALENSQLYNGTPLRTGQQAGKYIGVGISDKASFKEYTFFLQPDGSLLFTVSYVLNREGIEADHNWYKVADPSLYQYLLATYFPNEPV